MGAMGAIAHLDFDNFYIQPYSAPEVSILGFGDLVKYIGIL